MLELAERTESPHAGDHGYKTIADIMRSLNPFEGEFYREALQVSRSTREMFCLMEGRHVHPSTLYPGGVGTTATIQLFTDYLTRLMRYVEFMKRVVPMHDDLFDFFYQAIPGYEEVGQPAHAARLLGAFQDPEVCNFEYQDMTEWGRKHVRDARRRRRRQARDERPRRHQPRYPHPPRPLVLRRLGRPGDVRRHGTRSATLSTAATRGTSTPTLSRRNVTSTTSTRGSCRLAGSTARTICLDTGGGPLARLWSTALSGLVDIGYVKATGTSVQINLPKTALKPEVSFEWKVPKWTNTIERNRARTYFQAYAAACALHFAEKALEEIRAGHTKTWEPFEVPDEGIGCGFTEAVRGVLSHHMVIRDGKIANYHPYPPTPWNANPRDVYGTPGPYEDAVQNTPIFEENDREHFKGIDIMRTVRSFDPCLPCGVHMYLGKGKTLAEAALADDGSHPRRWLTSGRAESPRRKPETCGAGDRIECSSTSSPRYPTDAPANGPRTRRSVTDLTAPAWNG